MVIKTESEIRERLKALEDSDKFDETFWFEDEIEVLKWVLGEVNWEV